MKALLLAALAALPCAASAGVAPGTLIETVAGSVKAGDVKPGDLLLTYVNERISQSEVKGVSRRTARVVQLRAGKARLTLTSGQKLLTRYGAAEAGAVKAGDEIAALADGKRIWVKVTAVRRGAEAEVCELETAPPHTWVAGGFIISE